jgi:hypothetical protein
MDKRLGALTLFLICYLLTSCGSSGSSYIYPQGTQCPLSYNPFDITQKQITPVSFDGSAGAALPAGNYTATTLDYIYYSPVPNPSEPALPHDVVVHVQELAPTPTNPNPADNIQCVRNARSLNAGMTKSITVINAMKIVPGQPISYSTKTIGFQTTAVKSMAYGFQNQSALQTSPTPAQALSGLNFNMMQTGPNNFELHGQTSDANNAQYYVRVVFSRTDLPPAPPPPPPPAPPPGPGPN